MRQTLDSYDDLVGELGNASSDPQRLPDWLEACGNVCLSKGGRFVVIVDGLDHVWREADSVAELQQLFDLLLPVPAGVTIIIGTQPVSDNYLPHSLVQEVPRQKWRNLPAFTLLAVRDWLLLHESTDQMDSNNVNTEYFRHQLASAFYEVSQGHPLHLHYCWRALTEQNIDVTEQNVRTLPSCPHGNIDAYYTILWGRLDERAQHLLHLIAAFSFPWPKKGLMECLSPHPGDDSDITSAVNSILHLLRADELGRVPFHVSLIGFVIGQDDHADYKDRLRASVLAWLASDAPPYWGWAYEWVIQAEGGSPQELLKGASEEWLANSVAAGWPAREAVRILIRAQWVALQEDNLAALMSLGLRENYLERSLDLQQEVWSRMSYCHLRHGTDDFRWMLAKRDISDSGPSQLLAIAEAANEIGDHATSIRCFEIFHGNAKEAEQLSKLAGGSDRYCIQDFLTIAAVSGGLSSESAAKWIQTNPHLRPREKLIQQYARALWRAHKADDIRDACLNVCDLELSAELLRYALRLACEERLDLGLMVTHPELTRLPLIQVYRSLKGQNSGSVLEMAAPSIAVLKLAEYQLYDRGPEIGDLCWSVFVAGLAGALSGGTPIWLDEVLEASSSPWIRAFLRKLAACAERVADQLECETPLRVGKFFQMMAELPPPEYERDRAGSEFHRLAYSELAEIGIDLFLLATLVGGESSISKEDLQDIENSRYCPLIVWIDTYIAAGRRWLSADAVQWLLENQERVIGQTIDELPIRAERYARLAQIAVLHGEEYRDVEDRLLISAAKNILGYGNHKDMLLLEVLESIRLCHEYAPVEAEKCLFQVAPMVHHVEEYTDGRETHQFPVALAEIILDTRPDLFAVYYKSLIESDDHYSAERALRHVWLKGDLDDPFAQAAGRTIVDSENLDALEERAASGDDVAKDLYAAQLHFLGRIPASAAGAPDAPRSSLGIGIDAGQEKDISSSSSPASYPPGQLLAFLQECKSNRDLLGSDSSVVWLDYWCEAGRKNEVFEECSALLEGHNPPYEMVKLYDRMFDLCLELKGVREAYVWLTRAHVQRWGWATYFVSESDAVRRWEAVKSYYPEKWLDFIKDTAEAKTTKAGVETSPVFGTQRLVEYCAHLGKWGVALDVTQAMVDCTLARSADLPLTRPSWIPEY